MTTLKKAFVVALTLTATLAFTACSPEVGSDQWCAQMKEKPKGDWSANDAGDYTKHCLLK